MEDFKFVVGQEFSDVKTFRKTIKEAAIAQHFELRIIKSDLIRYFARCATDGCPWRIRAVKLPNVPTFVIRSIEGTHTCGKIAQNGHHQASVDWIVDFIEKKLRDDMNYKPKDILEDIQKQYGITIPYKQAWRAREKGLAIIYGSSEEGYCLLPAYCEQIMNTNPGSIAQVFTTGTDCRFQRLFVSFYACIYGFINGCLPLIGLGATQLKSKYLGTLLSATSFDADGGLFPLAFGIVDVENDESWMWFLSELHKLIEMNTENIPQLTFLSDGQKGIADAVKSVSKEFKNSRLVHLIWKAAYSMTTMGYKEKMGEIEEISAEAAKYIQQILPSRWAVAYFEGKRFGHLSTNIEEFNKWVHDARELPIIQVIERIHSKLISEFDERRKKGLACMSILAPSAETRILDAISGSSTLQVLRSDEVEFEMSTHSQRGGFTVTNYLETYSQVIHPIPDKSEWSKTGEGHIDRDSKLVRPPKIRRPPGRPEKKRLCVEDLNREKHTVHCSRCNQTGHYKTTCKADAILTIEQH
ncbi:hypothetical protein AQUCO_12000027v1 [Aquilegia coerulea]|uniref:CCHC-type domain-containing protein n=1 Tax=Aquilegia coerulea TaxID=218851 RepID=A0A2G5C221_AQUCA|nr:hypothetical protein AQUCO_12000027v1 [Aquilegia coerulea]